MTRNSHHQTYLLRTAREILAVILMLSFAMPVTADNLAVRAFSSQDLSHQEEHKAMLEAFRDRIRETAAKIGFDEERLEDIIEPVRVIEVDIPGIMDKNGNIKTIKGYRVLHSNDRGPGKGGFRFLFTSSEAQVIELATEMTLKCAVSGIPYGGAKGAVLVDPAEFNKDQLEKLTRGYVRALLEKDIHAIGPLDDIPAPDMGTNAEIMGWFADEYEKVLDEKGMLAELLESMPAENPVKAVVTSKPLDEGGLNGREEATGRGLFYAAVETLRKHNPEGTKGKTDREVVSGKTIAFQGYGNVGFNGARIFDEEGALVVALWNNVDGEDCIIYNEVGINLASLNEWIEKEKDRFKDPITGERPREIDLRKFPDNGNQELSPEEFWALDIDMILPCALGGQITEEVAGLIRADYIVEGANGPTTPKADKILTERGVIVVPDILANEGGVIGSYLEWLQNLQAENETWSYPMVRGRLHERMKTAVRDVFDYQKIYQDLSDDEEITLRESAILLALMSIADAKWAEPAYDQRYRFSRPVSSIKELNQEIARDGGDKMIKRAEGAYRTIITETRDDIARHFRNVPGRKAVLLGGPRTVGKRTVGIMLSELLTDEQPGRKAHYVDLDANHDIDVIADILNGEKRVIFQHNNRGKTESKIIEMGEDDILVIEGNQAMSNDCWGLVDGERRYPVFATMLPDFALDGNWPLMSTDLQLVMEMLDAYRREKMPPLQTIRSWPGERRQQVEEIYPESWPRAFKTINLWPDYAIAVFKPYIEAMLREIDTSLLSAKERRLIMRIERIFKGIEGHIDYDQIPGGSVVRQFIAGELVEALQPNNRGQAKQAVTGP